MLRKSRIVLALLFFIGISALFLLPSEPVASLFSWMPKLQFWPSLVAVNTAVIVLLIVLTLILGRIYCSVICPLGVFQDIVSRLSSLRRGKARRFRYKKSLPWLRYGILIVFVGSLFTGAAFIVALLEPYSAFGRILRLPSLIEAGLSSGWTPALAAVAAAAVLVLAVVGLMAWFGGRTWCNSICPVGTLLSFASRISVFRPVIDMEKCKKCHLCEHKCKASCIDISSGNIDYSRCVDCFDCLDECRFGALKYRSTLKKTQANDAGDTGRRAFLISSLMLTAGAALKAQSKKLDGGLAEILPKSAPQRSVPLVPFGSRGVDDFYRRCTACQLCISRCPNHVLKPSSLLEHLMQPEMDYSDGWCRPECNDCSKLCPTEAIMPYSVEEKSRIHIGLASVDRSLCVVETREVSCGNCARHCPAGAIVMVRKDADNPDSLLIPAVNEELCIGCGACENLCPSRPVSAIRVVGRSLHIKD